MLIHPRALSPATRIALVRALFALVAAGAAQAAPVVFAADGAVGGGEGEEWHGEAGGWARGAKEAGWAVLKRQVEAGGGGGEGEVVGHKEFILKLVFSILFVLLGGVFSGLSLGLMGLDSTNLQVLATSGPPSDRRDAQKVLKLLSHGRHFVLCTLLLSNVVVNETLPVFLDTLTGGGGLLAVLISSALIVIFGEVLPQALCAQHGLRIGARCVGFVRVLMYLESPINYPVAKLLDLLLGSHTSTLYRREELKTLISLHASSAPSPSSSPRGEYAPVGEGVSSGAGAGLGEMEVELVNGVLGLAEKTAEDAVRSLRDGGAREVYCVNDGMRVCDVDVRELLLGARTYIPVTRAPSFAARANGDEKGQTFVGYLRVEQIVEALSRPNELIRSLPLSPLVQVLPSTSVIDCIAYLKKENPDAVLLVSEGDPSSDTTSAPPLGFLSLADLSIYAFSSPTSSSPVSASAPPLMARETGRASLARPRARSSSIGLGRFVQGIVDRQLAHAQQRARGHRASSSQLSFRLSSSEEDNDLDSDGRPILPLSLSHSHHRSTSSLHSLNNFRPAPPSSSAAGAGPSGSQKPFRFPSPVFEEGDTFSLRGLGKDDENEEGDDAFSVASLESRGKRPERGDGEGDDSGFGGEETGGEVLFEMREQGEGGGGEGRDPLGVSRGKGG
ncbi:hypothetical protein JCM6882_008729 [Rhodosporidiobolus microsporus]